MIDYIQSPRSTGTVTSIFLSYARSDDEPFVRILYKNLIKRGFEVWFDRVSMPSRALSFLHEIRDAIASRDRLILVVGPGALASDYVTAEWQWALEIGKAINPVLRIGDYSDIPDELRLLDTQDFRDDARYAERLETLSRQLEDPVPPMGKLIGVRSLPAHFLHQDDRLRILKDAVMADLHRPVVMTGTSVHVGVQGMGGIGKSVLAAALARDYEVRRAFPDGVIWVDVGQAPSLVQLQRTLAMALGDPGHFDTLEQGRAVISGLLADRVILLLLDDLWDGEHAKAFDVLGPKCRMVVTTRDAGLLTALGGTQYLVQLLTTAEARHLLAECAGVDESLLPAVADEVIAECGRLPLALAICGGMVHDGERWTDLRDALKEADLGFLDHPQGSVLKTIKISITALPADEVERFTELAVFPPDETVPESAVLTLWAQTGGLSPRSARSLLTRLGRRALVQLDMVPGATGEEQDRRVSLHDLIHDCARMRVGRDNVVSLHQKLIDAYKQVSLDGWATGPDDGYFLQHLCNHLIGAGRQNEATELLLDIKWIKRMVTAGLVNRLIEDYNLVFYHEGTSAFEHRTYEALRLVQGALRLSAKILASDPSQLPSQLYGRLVGFESPLLEAFCSQIAGVADYPWLRPFYPSLIQPGTEVRNILTGHSQEVTSVAISADGKWGVSGSDDTTVRVWDLEKGSVEPKFVLEGHMAAVTSVAISAEGNRVVSGSLDTTVIVWDFDRRGVKSKRTLEGHKLPVTGVALSANGEWMVSGFQDTMVIVWNLENGSVKPERVLEGTEEGVTSVAISSDGTWAAAGTSDTLLVWNLKNGNVKPKRKLITFGGGGFNSVTISADGKRVVAGARSGSVDIWNLTLEEQFWPEHMLREKGGSVMGAALSADGKRVVSGNWGGSINVWDLDKGGVEGPERVLERKWQQVTSVAISADGKRAISGHWGATLFVWDFKNGTKESEPVLKGHTDKVTSVAVSADGKLVVSGSWDETLLVWEFVKGRFEPKRMLNRRQGQIFSVAVSADGKRVLSTPGGGYPLVWDLEKGKSQKRELIGNNISATAGALSADGKRAVSVVHDSFSRAGNCDVTLSVWDLETGNAGPTNVLSGHKSLVNSVALSADGQYMVSGSLDTTVMVWNLENGNIKLERVLKGHTNGVAAIAISADGKRAMSGSSDTTVMVWDLENGNSRPERVLKGHTDGVTAVAISADGKWGVSGSDDTMVIIWDLDNGIPVTRFYSDVPIYACALSADNRTIVAGGSFGKMIFLAWEARLEND